jgi:hypothetical protein
MHAVAHEAAIDFPAWLTAIGGVGAFLATVRLAYLAKQQIDAGQRQAASEAERVEKQIAASIKQGEAIREAARAQLQPMVFAHGDQTHIGPDDEYRITDGQVGFGYRLKNEGTGLALNIRHGVTVDGQEVEYEEGQWRALRPGEAQPAFDYVDPLGHFIRVPPWVVVGDQRRLPSDWSHRIYWARFENVFGERFVTRNPSDPTQAAEFERLDGPTSA